MKKLLALFLALVIACSLCACANDTPNTDGKLKIGICISSWTSNPIFIDAGTMLKDLANKNNWELYEKDLTTDTVINSLEGFISVGCDIVIVQANQAPDAVSSMIPQFESAGITLGIFDTDAFAGEKCVAYSATCDNYNAGYAIGKYAAEWANENMPGVVIKAGVLNREGNETFRARAEGIEAALNELLDNGKVEASFDSKGNAEAGAKVTEDLMSAIPDMNMVVAWNGGCGVGAYEALRAANYQGVLFTCDCSQDEVKAMMNNDFLKASVNFDTGNEIVKLVQRTAEYVANGCKYPEGTQESDKTWFFPNIIVTQAEASKYLNE